MKNLNGYANFNKYYLATILKLAIASLVFNHIKSKVMRMDLANCDLAIVDWQVTIVDYI